MFAATSHGVEEVPYTPKGAVRQLFFCRDPEVLLEGPAGTGKTRGLLEYVYWLCVTYPGLRVLFARKTRESLTESVLVTWETKVLPNGPEEKCVTGTATPANRRSYTFPFAVNEVNGVRYSGRSHIAVIGLDKASRRMSTEFDIICLFEAHEFDEEDYEYLLTRNRNYHIPWQQVVCDTNPASNQHWLHRRSLREYVVPEELRGVLPPPRPGQKQITRLLSRHWENPMLWDEARKTWTLKGALYMRKLFALTGPRAARLLRGEWVPSEGQVWDIFDSSRHMTYRQRVDEDGRAVFDEHPRDHEGKLKLDWYFASVDWGWRAPGCLQIWGVVGNGLSFERMYRIHEVYRVRKQLDWWCEAVIAYDRMYDLQAVVVDPSRQDMKATMNDRLGEFRNRPMSSVCVDALNAKEAGIDMVRYGLNPGEAMDRHQRPEDEGLPLLKPKLYLCWDALEAEDPLLREAKKPLCTEQEIPGYTWKETMKGKQVKEETDPSAADHGCDATRYAAMFAWGRDLTPEPRKPTFEPGSMGDVCGHDDVTFEEGYGDAA